MLGTHLPHHHPEVLLELLLQTMPHLPVLQFLSLDLYEPFIVLLYVRIKLFYSVPRY